MKKLAIFTKDKQYNLRLSNYLSDKLNHEFLISIYSESDILRNEIISGQICVLITDEGGYKKLTEIFVEDNYKDAGDFIKTKVDKFICLVDDKRKINRNESIINIYRYTSTMDIVMELSTMCVSNNVQEGEHRVVGIFSPIGGIGSTSFSIALAKRLSRTKSVLFFSLEAYCPIVELMCLDERYSLSEALYEYTVRGEETFFLTKYVQEVEGFSIIPPIRSLRELSNVNFDEWKSFINALKEGEKYEEIVIELSEAVCNVTQLFNICDKVVIPCGNKAIQKAKIDLFKAEIKKELLPEFIEERIEFVELPIMYEQEDAYENLEKTEFGEWIEREYG